MGGEVNELPGGLTSDQMDKQMSGWTDGQKGKWEIRSQAHALDMTLHCLSGESSRPLDSFSSPAPWSLHWAWCGVSLLTLQF